MLKKILLITLVFMLIISQHSAQDKNSVEPTPSNERLESFQKRIELQQNSLLKNVEFRSVGPTIMSGRVTDVDVSPDDPTHFYVAYASGGLWKTTNNGISFSPLFDDQASMTIGEIAVDWTNNIIYVGTGENNSSRSSYAGTGIYKSTNDGKSWSHLGLAETHRTGRIILHPENPNIIWVAALGHLYSPNPERGVYKSTDGGNTWDKTLYVDDNTGAIDLIINPQNENELYAAMWYRTRRAWNLVESGSSSGIYKSADGGNTWELLSGEGSGFPDGEGIGRIGLAIYNDGKKKVIYAMLDNQTERKKETEEEFPVTKDILKSISKEDFLNMNDDDLNDFLDRNNFPRKYNAESIKEQVKKNEISPMALVEFLEDANSMLFDTPITGAEVYKSNDGGKNWAKTHEGYLDGIMYTYGYYFGEIHVSAFNPDKIYVMGVPILKSEDGGKTFSSIGESNVHADHHALWVSPYRKGHLINGNDGGINISYDDGETWFKANTPAVGQFYTVNVDMEKRYNVYGGLQDNGVWVGPSTYSQSYRWYSSGQYPYKSLMGGDGMHVAIDTRDNSTVYTGFQFGNYYKLNKTGDDYTSITPLHELGERPFRWNWQSPIHLSRHNQDILYMGSNKLHRSMNQGESFTEISDDLTKGGKKGDVPYGTLTTIDESPLKFGLIYTGSDDGYIHVTKDGGNSWDRISDNLPQDFWVSRVAASRFDEGTVYTSLNGYRWDNFESLIYRSTDYGKTWERIGLDLPLEPVNVIKEDPVNKNLLYVGTDHALYASLDGGKTFMGMNKNLPYVPVHDLVVHQRDNDLVIGTHGRSIYIADVACVQKLTPDLLNNNLHLFELNEINYSERWGNQSYNWSEAYEPETEFVFYSLGSGNAEIKIIAGDGIVIKKLTHESDKGLNYVKYDLTIDAGMTEEYQSFINQKEESDITIKESDNNKTYIKPGEYRVTVEVNGNLAEEKLVIKEQKRRKRGE
ncbi:MAG: hypothetical protein K9J16_08575 [Melioribacteraceae bacterium]|nr:hypothetical protein [Melioribacteraceae bacterium]MCF8353801.1 hypothetical protein [Melioribacteraceae bacterium]MCF8393637.1 hypothetical protein [Melioribacteraceae bacterium]MCF8419447.1 hypothetical protein [Melioribacteraceae bacterium]